MFGHCIARSEAPSVAVLALAVFFDDVHYLRAKLFHRTVIFPKYNMVQSPLVRLKFRAVHIAF